jgi:hypothetical protein
MKNVNYVGQEYSTKNYGKIIIIKDLGRQPTDNGIRRFLEIKFLNTGSTKIITTSLLFTGMIKDNYARTVCGIGYLGNAKDYTKKEYDMWRGMLRRCYDVNDKEYINYGGAGVTVCDRWKCLEYFLNDLRKMENYDKLHDQTTKYQLDKDALQQENINKIYSPETCILIPQYSNIAMARRYESEKLYRVVYARYSDKKSNYIANTSIYNKYYHLGMYDDAQYAATIYDEINRMYGRFDLLNHTGISISEALQHNCSGYTSINDIRLKLPSTNMCTIVNNSKDKQMCYVVNNV